MSERGVSLGLTAEQVAEVLGAVATSGADGAEQLAALASPRELAGSPLLDDLTMSRSLLVGLSVLSSLPADGGDRGVKELATELALPTSTTHRYLKTLLAAGLLEQSRHTRRYRRSGRLSPGSAR